MTREEARKKAEIMLAYANGKEIEFYNDEYKTWVSINDPSFDGYVDYYRVKQEPKYRPFKDGNECFEEMKKHEPFGWVKIKSSGYYMCISAVYDECICFGSNNQYYHKNTLDKYTFIDGTPFGIKED